MAEPLRITVNPLSTPEDDPYSSLFGSPVPLDPRARDLVIRTVFGEDAARDEPSRAAIASVIRNRVQSGKYGEGPVGVISKPWAFEPWMNPTARERMRRLREDDPAYQSISQVVDQIFGGAMQDPTGGATHFFAPRAQAALRRPPPAWASGAPLANVGGHLFYAPDMPGPGASSSTAPARRGGATPERVAPPSTPPDDPYAQFEGQQPAPPAQPTATPKSALPQSPGITRGGAIQEGIEQGLSFSWADELRGLAAAFATIPGAEAGAGSALLEAVKIAGGAYERNPNNETWQAYVTARDAARQRYEAAKQQYPGTTLASEIVSGAVVPLPGGPLTSAGRATASRVGSGALQGAIAGTLSGAGGATEREGVVGNAALGGLAGAGLGAAVGGASPFIAEYIGRALHGIAAPRRQAEQQIARTAREAGRTSPESRVLPTEITPDTMVADLLGEPGRVLARGAKNLDPVAADILQNATMERARGQYPRLVTFLENKVGPLGDNEMAKLAVRAEQAQVTSPLYKAVMARYPSGIISRDLAILLQSNSTLANAAEKAAQRTANRAAVERKPVPAADSLEFWDQVKREVQNLQSIAVRAGDREAINELTGLSRTLIKHLDDMTGGANSPYAKVREQSAEYFSIERAIENGVKFAKSNDFTAAKAANMMRGMSPDAQEAFRKAALSQVLDKASRSGDTHNLWKAINNSPDAQQKMAVMFNGDRGAIREFEAMQRAEVLMERLREAVRGNSTTAQQLLMAGALGGVGGGGIGGVGGLLSGNVDPTTAGGAAAVGGAAALLRKTANYRMAEHLARMLVSDDPTQIDRAVKAAAGDERIMNVLRTMTENMMSRVGAAQTGRNLGD